MKQNMDQENSITLALLKKDIEYIRKSVDHIESTIKLDYVTRSEFEPTKRIVYGLIGLILTAVVGGLMGLIIIG